VAARRRLFRLRWLHRNARRGGNELVETRAGYFSNVRGIAVGLKTRHIFVNDRNNHRIQVFDVNGKYLYEWKINTDPSSLYLPSAGSGNTIWTYDRTTNKRVEYDLRGHLLYTRRSMGRYPGFLWNVHGVSADTDGYPYVAELYFGRIRKFTPRPGANPEFPLVKTVWKYLRQ
jgi:NHL repeat